MRLLPRSLLARVWALYAGTLIGVAVFGLGAFLAGEMAQQVARSRQDVRALLGLVLPTIADNAVVGDYDAIQRQMQRIAALSLVNAAEFRDAKGGRLASTDPAVDDAAPLWLQRFVAAQLDAPVEPVAAGGTRYGELRLELAAAPIAAAMWRQSIIAVGVAVAGLAAGLLLIRRPLKRWLGDLDRIAGMDLGDAGGRRLADAALAPDAPAEFRRTYEVLGRAASRLQAEREQAAATLQAIDDAVFTCDVEGRVVLANGAAQRLLGLAPEAIVGQALHGLLPALAEAWPREAGGAWRHHALEWTDAAGVHHTLDANLGPVRDAEGALVGRVLACRDVSELRRRDAALADAHAARDGALRALRQALEGAPDLANVPRAARSDIEAVSMLVSRLVAQLQERTAQLNAIFALSPDGFVSFSGEGQVLYASPGFVKLTGLSTDMVTGLEDEAFQARLRSRCAQAAAWPGLAPAESPEGVVLPFARPQRRVLALRLHRAADGQAGRLLHLRDVTRETELDRMKSEFIATAAHELRTPMVGIYGYAELLCTREMPPARQKDLLGRIHRQCEVMVRILNEMLDLARLEAGRSVDFAPEPADLGQLVGEALATFAPPPHREPPAWMAPALPVRVAADAPKLERALGNLLSNAYKYSPEGGVVSVAVLLDEKARRAGIVVEDRGIGLTPEQVARVGERFYRADESGAVLGTGLGVSLVREIAALHRGSLELRSTPGEGTAVTLWLPLAHEDAIGEPDVNPAMPAKAEVPTIGT